MTSISLGSGRHGFDYNEPSVHADLGGQLQAMRDTNRALHSCAFQARSTLWEAELSFLEAQRQVKSLVARVERLRQQVNNSSPAPMTPAAAQVRLMMPLRRSPESQLSRLSIASHLCSA